MPASPTSWSSSRAWNDSAVISIYRHNGFIDLCQGPHVVSTAEIPAMKLLSVAGAYWRGDEKRPMLQRIYGTAFESEDELNDHLARLEEAERRDHRTLGRQLGLYTIHDEIGPGLVVWHPKGRPCPFSHRRLLEGHPLPAGLRCGLFTPHRPLNALADQRSPGLLQGRYVFCRGGGRAGNITSSR